MLKNILIACQGSVIACMSALKQLHIVDNYTRLSLQRNPFIRVALCAFVCFFVRVCVSIIKRLGEMTVKHDRCGRCPSCADLMRNAVNKSYHDKNINAKKIFLSDYWFL